MNIGEGQLTPYTKRRVKREILNVIRYRYYYEMLTNRYASWDKYLRAAMFVGASLSVVAVFDVLPGYWADIAVGSGAALALLLATTIDFVWGWGNKSATTHAITLECCMIDNEYSALWARVDADAVSESEAQRIVEQLGLRIIAATSLLSETDRNLNEEATDASEEIWEMRWGNGDSEPDRAQD